MAVTSKTIRQRIQFAFNTDADSVSGAVFQYLIKNHRFGSREGKRKGIDAMVAFYKPFAFQDKEGIGEEELRAIAQDAVEALSRQIELLCSTFGLERPDAIAPDLRSEIKQAIAAVLSEKAIQLGYEAPKMPPTVIAASLSNMGYPIREEMILDEDALLGDLCSNAEAAA
jgi:hypothetical protein